MNSKRTTEPPSENSAQPGAQRPRTGPGRTGVFASSEYVYGEHMASTTTFLRLEEIRRERGVSLEQIANSTKISTRFLRAIESEEFGKLPGGVFNVNYIRQYATAIGFPEEKVLSQYGVFEAARAAGESDVVPVKAATPLRWMNWLRGAVTAPRS